MHPRISIRGCDCRSVGPSVRRSNRVLVRRNMGWKCVESTHVILLVHRHFLTHEWARKQTGTRWSRAECSGVEQSKAELSAAEWAGKWVSDFSPPTVLIHSESVRVFVGRCVSTCVCTHDEEAPIHCLTNLFIRMTIFYLSFHVRKIVSVELEWFSFSKIY